MAEEIRLSRFGTISFMFLIILLILLLGATMGIIIGSKKRIKQLEGRIVKLEAIEFSLTQLWEQVESFGRFMDRVDKLEVSLSQTKNLVKNLDRLPKTIAANTPPKVENSLPSKIPLKSAKKQYHTVAAGETLFSISHRYGLPIDKIRILNKLNKSSIIYPGQKLLVSL